MSGDQPRFVPALLGFGLLAFLIATLSIVDMYLPRPYDGVVLESDRSGTVLQVREVIRGSGAANAGIEPGDQIIGIARSAIRTTGHAAFLINQHEVGELVPYLIKKPGAGVREVQVELGNRQIGDTSYLYACVLGFSFFFIGLFVLLNQPALRVSRLFFILCSLFLLFLICRLRPASYSWVDMFVITTGTAALLFLPPAFLHFFLIFPHPFWDAPGARRVAVLRNPWVWRAVTLVMYTIPVVVFVLSVQHAAARRVHLQLLSGSPIQNWWVLAGSIVLGLGALAVNYRQLPPSRQRQGAAIVFLGSLFGLLPFIVLAVAFPSFLRTEKFFFYGLIPLILVPLTFAYAIIRFQLLDVKVILRRSLLYTATTAIITLFYGAGIAAVNALFRGTDVEQSGYFPLLFAITIVLIFEPVRRRVQVPVDRFFAARSSRLQAEIVEMGSAFTAETDPGVVVRELVGRLPKLLEMRYAGLYLSRGEWLARVAGPESLPSQIPTLTDLSETLREQGGVTAVQALGSLRVTSPDVDSLMNVLDAEGVEILADLSTPRRLIGLVVLAGKDGRIHLDRDELKLLRGLLNQAALALETSLLLDDRARQAELERELEIASTIQQSLLPRRIELGDGWNVAAVCRPARQVGGDFFAELPGPSANSRAVIYGDVSGKSVSGALMMMAAKEALHSIATFRPAPDELFTQANRRLYDIWSRSFVALGYFAVSESGGEVVYVVAGQPHPIRKCRAGIEELPLPEHRLPLGAMANVRYEPLRVELAPGEIIVAYSDGVTEAQAPSGEFFGSERLESVIRSAPADPHEIVDRILSAIDQFTAGNEQYDDVTLMAIARREEIR